MSRRRKRRNTLKILFVIFVIILVIATIYLTLKNESKNANTDSNEVTSNLSVAQNLKLGIQSYDTMNPILTKNKEIINYDKLIFEPLVDIDENYNLKNCLAKSCEKKDDLNYEIKVDSSVKWQDGSSLISKDILFTIEQIKKYGGTYSRKC